MSHQMSATRITLLVNRLVLLILAVLLPTFPALLRWYSAVRELAQAQHLAILIGFYCCVPVTGLALWQLDALLRNILKEQVFVPENVRCVRIVRWCCAGISLICLPAACLYYPLIFMVIIMGFLSLVVTVLVRVLNSAVSIREENDLTV